MAELKTETIGEIITLLGNDGVDFRTLLSDALGRPIMMAGSDGLAYKVLKTNASGQLEMVVVGTVPEADTLEGYHAADFVLKAGDTMLGDLVLAADPDADMEAATKQYVDAHAVSPGILVKSVWDPDAPPASANAKDDEFADLSFNGAIWTHFDPGNILATSEIEQGACLQAITSAADSIAGEMQPVNDADFTMWCKVALLGSVANTLSVGIAVWQDGILNPATSDIVTLGLQVQAANFYIKAEKWSAYNTWVSTLFSVQYVQPVSAIYLRLKQTSTTLEMDFSTDGVGWYWKHSVARPFTPKQVGLFIDNNNSLVTARAIYPFFRFLDSVQSFRTPPSGRLVKMYA